MPEILQSIFPSSASVRRVQYNRLKSVITKSTPSAHDPTMHFVGKIYVDK